MNWPEAFALVSIVTAPIIATAFVYCLAMYYGRPQ